MFAINEKKLNYISTNRYEHFIGLKRFPIGYMMIIFLNVTTLGYLDDLCHYL